MHVAYFVGSFPKVSETFIMNQIEAMLSSGHQISIFANDNPDEGVVHRKVEEYDMVDLCTYTNPPKTYPAGMKRTIGTFLRHPEAAVEIFRAIRGQRPGIQLANLDTFLAQETQKFDAYHAHFGNTGEDWSFIHRLPDINVSEDKSYVVSFYGFDASSLLERDFDPYPNVFADADAITVLSGDMKENLIDAGCPPEKLTYNPLGIDTNFFEYKERRRREGSTKLLIVSRLIEKKGVSMLSKLSRTSRTT